MSFLIKGIEIPKNGERLSIDIYPDGKVSYNLDLECKQIATAVSVPTPHGRLVDVDSLMSDLQAYSEEVEQLHISEVQADDIGIATAMYFSVYNCTLKVESAPIIIEAEE